MIQVSMCRTSNIVLRFQGKRFVFMYSETSSVTSRHCMYTYHIWNSIIFMFPRKCELCSSGMQQQQPGTVTHSHISSLLIFRRLSRPRVTLRYSVRTSGYFNPLGPIAPLSVMRLSASWCHFWQCPWDLGSAWAERAGQGEVGECTQRVQTAWPRLSSSLEVTWLALGGPFLSFLA